MADNESSAVNAVLLTLILIVLVIGLMWFFGALPIPRGADTSNDDASIEINLPDPSNGGEGGGQGEQ